VCARHGRELRENKSVTFSRHLFSYNNFVIRKNNPAKKLQKINTIIPAGTAAIAAFTKNEKGVVGLLHLAAQPTSA